MTGTASSCWLTAGLLLLIPGCGPPKISYPEALNSERPGERVLAIKHAAETEDKSDEILGILDALLYQYRFKTTNWSVKRILRRSDRTIPRDEDGIVHVATDWVVTAYQRNV